MNDLKNYVDGIAKDIFAIYDGTTQDTNEDGEKMTLWDYFADVLDVEYLIGADMSFRGCKIMVACGGPNIWVDTTRGEVFGAWGCDRETAWIPSEICEEIDLIFEELFDCAR